MAWSIYVVDPDGGSTFIDEYTDFFDALRAHSVERLELDPDDIDNGVYVELRETR